MPIDVEEAGVDLLALSSHKLHGPKGVGALYVRKEVQLEPLIRGGGQEQGMRAGTENVPGIVGFGKAVELALTRLHGDEPARLIRLRDRLEAGILALLPAARRNGPERGRLGNTLNMTLPEYPWRVPGPVSRPERHCLFFRFCLQIGQSRSFPRTAGDGADPPGGTLLRPLLARCRYDRGGDRVCAGIPCGPAVRGAERHSFRSVSLGLQQPPEQAWLLDNRPAFVTVYTGHDC